MAVIYLELFKLLGKDTSSEEWISLVNKCGDPRQFYDLFIFMDYGFVVGISNCKVDSVSMTTSFKGSKSFSGEVAKNIRIGDKRTTVEQHLGPPQSIGRMQSERPCPDFSDEVAVAEFLESSANDPFSIIFYKYRVAESTTLVVHFDDQNDELYEASYSPRDYFDEIDELEHSERFLEAGEAREQALEKFLKEAIETEMRAGQTMPSNRLMLSPLYEDTGDCYERAGKPARAQVFFDLAPKNRYCGLASEEYSIFLEVTGREDEALEQLLLILKAEQKFITSRHRKNVLKNVRRLAGVQGMSDQAILDLLRSRAIRGFA